MVNRKIIFRSDGGPSIGMGHFIRSLALAEMLKDEFYCIFAIQSPTVYQINEIEKVCTKRINLPLNVTHFGVFLNYLKGDEIVVLDNYYFTTEYQKAIKAKGCKLICIDDMHNKHFVADVIINHAEGVSELQYSAEEYTKFCLGIKYALLRKEYLTNLKEHTFKKYACLLMMGGADPFNLTVKFVPMIDSLQLQLPIAVVIGNGFANESFLKQFKNIVIFKGLESSKIFQLMNESQLGFFPASTVAIEACAARLPFICGYFIDNQKDIYAGICKNDLAYCVENLLFNTLIDIQNAFSYLKSKSVKNKIIQNQKTLLDKRSKERYIKTFKEL